MDDTILPPPSSIVYFDSSAQPFVLVGDRKIFLATRADVRQKAQPDEIWERMRNLEQKLGHHAQRITALESDCSLLDTLRDEILDELRKETARQSKDLRAELQMLIESERVEKPKDVKELSERLQDLEKLRGKLDDALLAQVRDDHAKLAARLNDLVRLASSSDHGQSGQVYVDIQSQLDLVMARLAQHDEKLVECQDLQSKEFWMHLQRVEEARLCQVQARTQVEVYKKAMDAQLRKYLGEEEFMRWTRLKWQQLLARSGDVLRRGAQNTALSRTRVQVVASSAFDDDLSEMVSSGYGGYVRCPRADMRNQRRRPRTSCSRPRDPVPEQVLSPQRPRSAVLAG